jgi:tRNA/rRNA methyltransferase/tRNA (cytidine32/uridine32-2'-O)-methyltransferase
VTDTTDTGADAGGAKALDRFTVVLYQPQDLVNIALVVRAMHNFGLTRLRLIEPAEFSAYRILGIAHDTDEVVERIEVFESVDDALADMSRAVALTARRRASRQAWFEPAEAAERYVDAADTDRVALVFGREDRGLPNEVMDLCDEAICIPTNPDHTSLNLGHAAVILFYEIRRAVGRRFDLEGRDLSIKPRDQAPPATTAQMQEFFGVWEEAMTLIGMFRGVDPTSRMRTYRGVFHRADMDLRELRLMEASAYRVLYYARRLKTRLEKRYGGEDPSA